MNSGFIICTFPFKKKPKKRRFTVEKVGLIFEKKFHDNNNF